MTTPAVYDNSVRIGYARVSTRLRWARCSMTRGTAVTALSRCSGRTRGPSMRYGLHDGERGGAGLQGNEHHEDQQDQHEDHRSRGRSSGRRVQPGRMRNRGIGSGLGPVMPRSSRCCSTQGRGLRSAPAWTPRTSRSPPAPARSACTARAMRSAPSRCPGAPGNWPRPGLGRATRPAHRLRHHTGRACRLSARAARDRARSRGETTRSRGDSWPCGSPGRTS